MYFVQGIACETVGYRVTGKAYCDIVHDLIPVLFPELKNDYFPNTGALFLIWYNRGESEKLRMQKKEIERKLGENQKININTIGVESGK